MFHSCNDVINEYTLRMIYSMLLKFKRKRSMNSNLYTLIFMDNIYLYRWRIKIYLVTV